MTFPRDIAAWVFTPPKLLCRQPRHRGTPHTEQLHTIERWTRICWGRMVNEFTLEDPGAFSKPMQLKFTARLLRPDPETGTGDLMEFICLEDNQYGKAGGLQGIRSGTSNQR